MKFTMGTLSPIFVLLLLATVAHTQSPREQFQQMVEQLQKNPSDTALREKIIKLAQELKPPPAVPEETERRMARGEAAFESAKDASGYETAVREFQAAANAAPWHSNAYFNLGIAQEKANKPKEAMKSFQFYLLAAPDGKDAAEVKKRIYKLEFAAEQKKYEVEAVEREKKRNEAFMANLEGAQWRLEYPEYCDDGFFEIHNGDVFLGWITLRNVSWMKCGDIGRGWWMKKTKLEGLNFSLDGEFTTTTGIISEDGETIRTQVTGNVKGKVKGVWEGTETYIRVKNPRWSIMKPGRN
jgi:tetratricopeptide (TPR) repeat protein